MDHIYSWDRQTEICKLSR